LKTDGTLCYKKKNMSDKIKLSMKPEDVLKLKVSKRYLTVTLKDQTLSFKFSSSEEA
jgi:hypothetical protein